MLIGLTIYSLVGILLGFLIGLLLPAVSIIVTFLIIASTSAIPILLGTRFGLQSRDVRPSIKVWGLVVPAMIYGVVQGVGMTIVFGLMIVFTLVLPSSAIPQLNETSDLAREYLGSTWAIPAVAGLVAVFLSTCSIRASLLVPITSASIGRDPDGLHYTPFRHFRASFGPLFVLTVLSYVGSIILSAGALILTLVTGYAETLSAEAAEFGNMVNGRAPIRPLWFLIFSFLAYSLIGLWVFSLQCAGGVLGYLKLAEEANAQSASNMTAALRQPSPPPIAKSGPKMSNEDLRALRKSREFRD